MEEFIRLIADNGIGIVCVGYVMYSHNTIMKDMTTVLNSINTRLAVIEDHMKGEAK